MTDLNRWEYRFESMGSIWSRPKDEVVEDLLNGWGDEGWELVNIVIENNKMSFLARRPLTLTTRRQRSLPGY